MSKVSPNGKYAVGSDMEPKEWAAGSVEYFRSFIWDLKTGAIDWLTEFDQADYNKSGCFTDVNDDMTICGYFKSPNHKATLTNSNGMSFILPLNVAALWMDGKLHPLGFGDYDTGVFNDVAHGSFATAVSNDSRTVVGYISSGQQYYTYPCAWVLNDGTGEYDFVRYALPENGTYGKIYDVSDDGSIAVGQVEIEDETGWPGNYACYWTSPEECVVIDDPSALAARGCAYAVSGNGEYVAFTLEGREPSLYIVQEGRIVKCSSYEGVTGLGIAGVSDYGDIFGTYTYGTVITGTYNRSFWYSHSNSTLTDFNYFTDMWAQGADLPYDFTVESKESVSLVSVSAKGDVVAGNGLNEGFALVTAAEPYVIPPTVELLKAQVTDLGVVTLEARTAEAPEGLTPVAVTFYRDGGMAGETAVAGGTAAVFVDEGVPVGEHSYTSSVVYENGEGGRIVSPRSEPVAVPVEDTFDMPLYDNFDSGFLTTNYWTVAKDYGQTAYQTVGCVPYSGFNSSYCLFTGMSQTLPYSYSAVSRNIDARGKNSVYVSFARRWEPIGSGSDKLDEDTVSIEVSADGATWESVKDIILCEAEPNSWGFEFADITPWAAGKLFKVRIRFHGQAAAQYMFKAEEFAVFEQPARKGMTDVLGGVSADGGFRLAWKNSMGVYPLTYIPNIYYNAGLRTLSDEGKTIIAANMFDKDDLGMFKGKYLTSVTTMVNHDTTLADSKDSRVSVVVFEDGRLVREQEFTPDYNNVQVVKLDEPLLIDGTKELKVGIKAFDYDTRQLPLVYYISNEYVTGKSDLYSQDGGNTWLNLSDTWTDEDGYASWHITANVTDEADTDVPDTLDTARFAAEVYKNGRKTTQRFVHYTEAGYTDGSSATGDTYQVRVFYLDGTCTELSNTVVNNGATGVGSAAAYNGNNGAYTIEDGKLTVGGVNGKVEIYNAEGVKVYEGTGDGVSLDGLGHGIFILKVYGADGKTATHKLTF